MFSGSYAIFQLFLGCLSELSPSRKHEIGAISVTIGVEKSKSSLYSVEPKEQYNISVKEHRPHSFKSSFFK